MSDVENPKEVEEAIGRISRQISEGVQKVTDRMREFKDAQREYDEAYARAYLKAMGSIEDKKRRAVLDCAEQKARLDVAEVAYSHVTRRAKSLELQLRGLQSIGSSLRTVYGVAGRGEA